MHMREEMERKMAERERDSSRGGIVGVILVQLDSLADGLPFSALTLVQTPCFVINISHVLNFPITGSQGSEIVSIFLSKKEV